MFNLEFCVSEALEMSHLFYYYLKKIYNNYNTPYLNTLTLNLGGKSTKKKNELKWQS